MTADHLRRLRYFLRDPAGKIWDDALILEVLNDVAQDLQWRTGLLADVRVQQLPPYWQLSYQHEFERAFLGSNRLAYRMGWNQANNQLATQSWEIFEAGQADMTLGADDGGPTAGYYRITGDEDYRELDNGDLRVWA